MSSGLVPVTLVDQNGDPTTISLLAGGATSVKQDTLIAQVGEVQASPTANTLLDRLKTISVAITNLLTGIVLKKGTISPVAVATQPTTAAQLLLASNANRIEAVFYNNGSQTIYLGTTSGVTTASFIVAIAAGGSFVDDRSTSAWYGITASGTADIKVGETV